MSVTIRLARVGRRHQPSYRIVVSNTRDKRNGKPLEILGNYNPAMGIEKISLDKKKLAEWQTKGALTSNAVSQLLNGEYKYERYIGNLKKGQKASSGNENTVKDSAEEQSSAQE